MGFNSAFKGLNKPGSVRIINNEGRSHIPFYRGTVIIITPRGIAVNKYRIVHSKCVSVALVTQDAMRLRPIILSSVACLAQPYFPTLSHKGQEFRRKMLLNLKCVS